jgi:hypothetical protein
MEGSLQAEVASLKWSVDKLREELKPVADDYRERQGRDRFLRDAGKFFGGFFAFLFGVFGVFKYGQSSGWFGK